MSRAYEGSFKDVTSFRGSGAWLLALFALSIPAFWPSYLNPPQVERDWHVHVHGIALFSWAILLVVQPWLIRTGKWSLHRRLGKVSYVLAPVVVVSTLLFMHYRVTTNRSFDMLYFLCVQFALITLFAVSWVQAIRWRHAGAIHARYMVCTALAMFDPIVARLLYNGFGIDIPVLQLLTYGMVDLILLALWMRDRRAGNGITVFSRMLALFVLLEAPTFVLPQTAGWIALAKAFAELPLP
jgi:uncharacterized membrane protein